MRLPGPGAGSRSSARPRSLWPARGRGCGGACADPVRPSSGGALPHSIQTDLSNSSRPSPAAPRGEEKPKNDAEGWRTLGFSKATHHLKASGVTHCVQEGVERIADVLGVEDVDQQVVVELVFGR